jgi:hypothetical protein
MAKKIDWQQVCDLTAWDEKPFTFQMLIDPESNSLETITVSMGRYVMVTFNDSKSISIGLNGRNPFTKFDRAAYVDEDGWLWVGDIYEG